MPYTAPSVSCIPLKMEDMNDKQVSPRLARATVIILVALVVVAVALIILQTQVWGPCEVNPRNC